MVQGVQLKNEYLAKYYICVKMPLTRNNQNVGGVHFGGSLYSRVDPFFMLLRIHYREIKIYSLG